MCKMNPFRSNHIYGSYFLGMISDYLEKILVNSLSANKVLENGKLPFIRVTVLFLQSLSQVIDFITFLILQSIAWYLRTAPLVYKEL